MDFKIVLPLTLSLTICSAGPTPIELKSQLPANPIEDPPSWAWGRHPRNGFGYKAKDSLAVEVLPLTLSLTTCSAGPTPIELKSQLPANPIEDPPSWAWGRHPRNGFGYKAKDSLAVEVCLANPALVDTAKCKLPLDVCLDNPSLLPLLGCSGDGLPLQVCLDFPKLLTSPACQASLTPKVCASTPSITTSPVCSDALAGYQPDLFTCQDNKEALCSLGLCEKHKFIVKC